MESENAINQYSFHFLISFAFFHDAEGREDPGIKLVVSAHFLFIMVSTSFRNICACANQIPVTQKYLN